MRESGGVVVAVAMCIGILTSVGTAALMAWFYIGQIRASVEIGAEQLVLNIPLYARAVPIQRIRADEAERISLIGDDSRRPSVRTMWRDKQGEKPATIKMRKPKPLSG